MNRFLTFGCVLFFMALLSFVARATGNEPLEPKRCDMHHGSCTRTLSGVKVTLDIHPKPVQAMKNLVFTVTLAGEKRATDTALTIDLGMPGMRMGPNRVLMTPVGEGTYEGKGVIVRCPSGKRTWRAAVTIPQAGTVDFIFDVVY